MLYVVDNTCWVFKPPFSHIMSFFVTIEVPGCALCKSVGTLTGLCGIDSVCVWVADKSVSDKTFLMS